MKVKVSLDPHAPRTNAVLGALLSGGDAMHLATLLDERVCGCGEPATHTTHRTGAEWPCCGGSMCCPDANE